MFTAFECYFQLVIYSKAENNRGGIFQWKLYVGFFWTALEYLQKEANAAGSRVRKPLSATDAFAKSILITKTGVMNAGQ